MKIDILNIQRIIFVIMAIGIFIVTRNYVRQKDSYQTTLVGVVEDIEQSYDKSYIIKFRGTSQFNVLSGFRTNNLIKKGDSIYKPMFSHEWFLYRRNQQNEYKLFKRFINE